MKKKLISAVLALVIVLGLLPMAVFADAPADSPAVAAYGFAWDGSALKGKNLLGGGKASGDWMDQTMYVIFAEAPAASTHLWFTVDVGSDTWGCAGDGNGTSKTFAFSFKNPGQWEKKPTEATEAGLSGEQVVTLKVYKTDAQVTQETADSLSLDTPIFTVDNFNIGSTGRVRGDGPDYYEGYTLAQWISDMTSAHSAFTSAYTAETGKLTSKAALTSVYANLPGVLAAVEADGITATNEQKAQVAEWKTYYSETVTKLDLSELDNKLPNMATVMAVFSGLTELTLDGNGVSNNGILPNWEGWAMLTTLKMNGCNVTNIDVLKDCIGLTTLEAKNLTGSLASVKALLPIIASDDFSAGNIVKWDFTGTTITNAAEADKAAQNAVVAAFKGENESKLAGLTVQTLSMGNAFTSLTVDSEAVTVPAEGTANEQGIKVYNIGPVEVQGDTVSIVPVLASGKKITSVAISKIVDNEGTVPEASSVEALANLSLTSDNTYVHIVVGEDEAGGVRDGAIYIIHIQKTGPVIEPITLTYTKKADLTDADAGAYYGGKLKIGGLTVGKTYVVSFDYGGKIQGGTQVPRACVVITGDASGEATLSCQETMRVIVYATGADNNVNAAELSAIFYDPTVTALTGVLVTNGTYITQTPVAP